MFYMKKVRKLDPATSGSALDRNAVVVEAVQAVLNVYFIFVYEGTECLKKWSWKVMEFISRSLWEPCITMELYIQISSALPASYI